MCIPFLKMFALFSTFSPVKPFLCCLLCVFKNIFSRYAFPFPSFPMHTHSFFFQFMIFFSLITFTSVYVCVTKYLVTIWLDLIMLVIWTLFFFFWIDMLFFQEAASSSLGKTISPFLNILYLPSVLCEEKEYLGFPLPMFVVYWCHPHLDRIESVEYDLRIHSWSKAYPLFNPSREVWWDNAFLFPPLLSQCAVVITYLLFFEGLIHNIFSRSEVLHD